MNNEITDAQLALEAAIRDDEREKTIQAVIHLAELVVIEQKLFGWLGGNWLRRAGAKAVLARLERLRR